MKLYVVRFVKREKVVSHSLSNSEYHTEFYGKDRDDVREFTARVYRVALSSIKAAEKRRAK